MRDRRADRGGRGFTRKVDTRPAQKVFLIVCEGAKTEPNYFRGFKVAGNVLDVRGVGDNTLSLVEQAAKFKERGEYDQTWCVFDRDSFPADRFNRALDLARRLGMRVAYSNEAFELWYLLHFAYHDCSRVWSNTSLIRFRNSIPKINSLYSEASIFPRRMSAAFIRKLSSWESFIFSIFISLYSSVLVNTLVSNHAFRPRTLAWPIPVTA